MRQLLRQFTNKIWEYDSRVGMGIGLLIILILLIPPNGALTANEELYFSLVSADSSGSPFSALSPRPYLFAFNQITWLLMSVNGAELGQILGRILVAALYATSLTTFFKALRANLLQALMAVLIFFMLGQEILGGEWLFGGFEPKTLAYPFCIFGISALLRGKLLGFCAFFAVATHFHFLVGGIWFGFCVLAGLWQTTDWRRSLSQVGLYLLLSLPIALVLATSYIGGSSSDAMAGDTQSAGQIFKYVRNPHHTAPFTNIWQLLQWLPGILSLPWIALIAMSLLKSKQDSRIVLIAKVVVLSAVFMILALPISALDKNGVLAPLFLFRPSSLTLLLWITLVLGLFLRNFTVALRQVTLLIAFTLLANSAPLIFERSVYPVVDYRDFEQDRTHLAHFIKDAPEVSLVLVDPSIEQHLLSLERRTDKPTLVMRKFFGNTRSKILEWNRRMEFRERVFDNPCADWDTSRYPVTHLIVSSEKLNSLTCNNHETFGKFTVIGRQFN